LGKQTIFKYKILTLTFIFLISLFYFSCEKNDSVVDFPLNPSPVISLNSFSTDRINIDTINVQNNKVSIDIGIAFTSLARLNKINYEIKYLDQYSTTYSGNINITNVSPAISSTEQKTYNGRFAFSIDKADVGHYQMIIYGFDQNDIKTNSLFSEIIIEKKLNIPPTLLKVVTPDTITISNIDQEFEFLAYAADSDGVQNLSRVEYNMTKPDGRPSDNNPFTMINEGGGIFAYYFTIPANFTNPKGVYKYVFQAFDKAGAGSNKITKNILLR
jgi:hypothetical protein